jgi:protocatechuate 3,4-dioxygenase beta subunit
MMNKQIDRRHALAVFGAMGLGTVLAACGGDDGGDTAAGGGTSTTGGSAGGSTTSDPSPAPGTPATADLFEGAGSCALTPEQTEGPYYLDIDKVRGDIREDRQGARLRVAIRVRDFATCTPLPDAAVDIWHCDALGLYSGFEEASTGGGGPGPGGPGGGGSGAVDETRYLRGTQVTNAEGIVEFTTIYPGWYRGRTVHIHCKVHLNNRDVLTTQFYFDEDFTKDVYARQPYASDTGRDTFNADDRIFSDETMLKLSKDGDGYLGVITLDVKRA